MNNLQEGVSDALRRIGMPVLEHPIFYNAPVGIRFEIGGEEEVYIGGWHDGGRNLVNKKYLKGAFDRAKAIYDHLPHRPDILRIDTYPGTGAGVETDVLKKVLKMGLPDPQEQKTEDFLPAGEKDTIVRCQLYWDISKSLFSPDSLLREIIRADFGGISGLVSNVFFINAGDAVLFHLYDDRGADLVAADKEMLRPIYDRYNQWVLDYDRLKIETLFAKC